VRISRLRLHDFRGWSDLEIRPQGHVLLAGVPRAGRSDIIAALARLLDPAFIRMQPALDDLRRYPRPTSPTETSGQAVAEEDSHTPVAGEANSSSGLSSDVDGTTVGEPEVASHAEVEVTLVDLEPELEQLCDGFLEPLDADSQVDESGTAAADAPLGVRLSYRVSYFDLKKSRRGEGSRGR